MIYACEYMSPLGAMLLTADDRQVTGIYFHDQKHFPKDAPAHRRDPGHGPLALCRRQLEEYFAGSRQTFDLPLSLDGTAFQQRIWQALRSIRCGETLTYGELARRVGSPEAVRAVGAAVGRNPVSIIVPCHRVLGAGGQLTGYAGGIERKQALLALEGYDGAKRAMR